MRFTIIAILGIFLCSSCHKTNTVSGDLIGKWELAKEVGGFAGTINYPPGNGTTMSFLSNHSYTASASGAATYTGTYSLRAAGTNGDMILTLMYNGQTQVDSIRLQDGNLLFLPAVTCCDVPTAFYRRLGL